MRILMISDYFPPYTVGGAEISTYRLAKGLKDKGHEVSVLTHKKKPFSRDLVEKPYVYDGIKVELFPRYIFPVFDPNLVLNLYQKAKGFDIIHVQTLQKPDVILPLLFIRTILNIPIVWTVRNYWFICHKGLLKENQICSDYSCRECANDFPFVKKITYLNRMKLRRFLRSIDFFVAPSKFVRKVIKDFGVPDDKISVISNYIDSSEFPYSMIHPNNKKVLFIGYLRKHKGGVYFLKSIPKVLREVPDALFVVVGDGPDKTEFEKFINKYQLKGHVKLVGKIPAVDMPEIYANSRLVVVPSIWPEPFGIIGLEAMSSGRPVVGTNVGGIPDWLVHGETGFLVEPKNENAIAKSVISLLKNDSLANSMGKKGREIVEQTFNLRTQCEKYEIVYAKLLSGK